MSDSTNRGYSWTEIPHLAQRTLWSLRKPTPDAEGEAWLLSPNDGQDASRHRFLEVAWQRANGDAWRFMSNGLNPERLIASVMSAQPGSGVPVVVPDAGLELVTMAGPSGTGVVRSQVWTVADQTVSVSVRDDGGSFQGVVKAEDLREITIAGADGYVAVLSNDQVEAVWDAGEGWWATMTIPPSLAARSDEVIQSVVAIG